MSMRLTLASCVALALAFAPSQTTAPSQRRPIVAPTFYIAIEGRYEDERTILVRGASDLPVGASISIQIAEFDGIAGWKQYSNEICPTVSETGLLTQEIHPKQDLKFRRGLIVRGAFGTELCKQPPSVLDVVGKKGQHLGNDNYDDAIDTSKSQTSGMFDNPQLFQSSGPHFGLEAIARIK